MQKFPVIVNSIGNEHRGRRFDIIIDEAHSGQGGRTTAIMSTALSKAGEEPEEETTEDKIKEEPYRFLVCAEKFQTGYDEPLLHTMYVDKTLTGIKAAQTLSRLNRARPQKHDTFVLDFADYYRTTILSEETDPNRLNDLQSDLDGAQVYGPEQVDSLVEKFFEAADRDRLDPILDAGVATYREELDEDGQVDLRGKAKGFLRTYGFLSAILPYNNAEWEKLSIFLPLLVPKLPAPVEDDLSQGILEAIDMDSYRLEKQAVQSIMLADEDAEIEPAPTAAGGRKAEPELERLSNIVNQFNDLFGDIPWEDKDKIRQVVTEEIPAKVAEDQAYQNAVAFSDRQNARVEHDKALQAAVTSFVTTYTTLFKQFNDDPEFHNRLSTTNFSTTYNQLAQSLSHNPAGSGPFGFPHVIATPYSMRGLAISLLTVKVSVPTGSGTLWRDCHVVRQAHHERLRSSQ